MQLTKINSMLPPTTIVNVYKPPASSRTVFLDELAELTSVISADMNAGLLLCGDMNCAGTDADNINDNLRSMFDTFGLTQHVNTPTWGDNLLDIIVIEDSLAVSGLSINNAGLVSDHRLVLATLWARPAPRQPTSSGSRTLFVDRCSSPLLQHLPKIMPTSWLTLSQLNWTMWCRYIRRRDVNLNWSLVGCRHWPFRRNMTVAAWRRCGNGVEKNRTSSPTEPSIVGPTNS